MRFRYESNGLVNEIVLERQGSGYRALIGGTPFEVEVLDSQPGEISLRVDGRSLRLYHAAQSTPQGERRWLALDGCAYVLDKPAGRRGRSAAGSAEHNLRAPMPAQVRAIHVAAGEAVEKGQPLLILEAMKMEIRLTAPRDGVIARLLVQNGETVTKDQILVELEDGG